MILETKFNLETFTHSNKAIECGIDNADLTDELFENLEELHKLLIKIQSQLSDKYSKPINIKINSAYRCPLLNKKIGGEQPKFDEDGKMIKRGSQHLYGEACDSTAIGISVKEYFDSVKELVENKIIEVDQCIEENFAWVHLSKKKENNRNQFLKMRIINGRKRYLPA